MKRTKIAFVCRAVKNGGAERVFSTLANNLANKEEYMIYLITAKRQEGEYLLSPKVRREVLLDGNDIFKDCRTVLNELKKEEIHIVIGTEFYENSLVCALKFFGRFKVVISERSAPKHAKISLKSKVIRRLLYHNADKVVFQTEGALKCYSKSIQRKGVIIGNPLLEVPYKSDVCNHEIVAVGRLSKEKNYSMLLRAFKEVHKEYPDYILRIFGEGNELEELKSLAVSNNIEKNVIFEGFRLDVHQQIMDSDIFVLTSDYEGLPNALMEAMAMGFPVIATNCPSGGPASLIENGKNGYLIPVKGELDLSKVIISLIRDKKRKQMIAKEAKKIRERYNEEIISNKWSNLLKAFI